MLILTIRTDKPEAEISLYDNQHLQAEIKWQAHRQLAETIHLKTKELLDKKDKKLTDLEGIVVFKGPGSFTGLRIGFSVANALADALKVPIIAAGGKNWQKEGITQTLAGKNDEIALPDYGAEPKTTLPKK